MIHSSPQPLDYVTSKRTLADRRNFTAKTIFRGFIKPRRKQARRTSDVHALIDYYGWGPMIASIMLIVLSACDAAFTLIIINNGGEELNPIMDYFLQLGTPIFVYVKMLVPLCCIFFFVACWNYKFFSIFRMRLFLLFSVAMYIVLIAYELVLLNRIFPDIIPII